MICIALEEGINATAILLYCIRPNSTRSSAALRTLEMQEPCLFTKIRAINKNFVVVVVDFVLLL